MKKVILQTILFFILKVGFTQTFEYQFSGELGKIFQVSDNEYVYGIMERPPWQFSIYSLDHTLIKTIPLAPIDSGYSYTFYHLSKTLINDDQKYELIYNSQNNTGFAVNVINDDGTLLFHEPGAWGVSLFNTDAGAKMILSYVDDQTFVKVYSLYGKVLKAEELNSFSETNLFPNPSFGKVEIEYSVPSGESDLTLTIYTLDTKFIRDYPISSNEKRIIIDVSGFRAGIYLYRIHNNHYSTGTKKFIVKNE